MKNTARPFVILVILLALALLVSVMAGSVFISPSHLWQVIAAKVGGVPAAIDPSGVIDTILFKLRLPRAVLLLLVGAALVGQRCDLSGIVPQSAGGPIPYRCILRRRVGGGGGNDHPLAVHNPGVDGSSPGGFCWCVDRRVGGHPTGKGGQLNPHHQPHPGRGGGQFICFSDYLSLDDQFHRGTTPHDGVVAGGVSTFRAGARCLGCCLTYYLAVLCC